MQSKKAVAVSLILGFMMPAMAAAQTTATSSIQSLLDQIKQLQAQIATLQQQQQTVVAQLVANLREGNRGEQVAMLQRMLAQDSSLYPEGTVSGYFGKLTAAAVKRFQQKHGIEQVGNVGPKTLKKLNEIFGKIAADLDLGVPGDHGNGTTKLTICHKGQTITVGAPAVQAHVKHGDTTGACGGGTGTTTDATAPTISGLSVSSIASTSATIMWTTNESATGKVYYGTVNPLVLGSATNVSTSTLSTGHTLSLTGLSASTTYYYVVESMDASNNTATSSQAQFTTTN